MLRAVALLLTFYGCATSARAQAVQPTSPAAGRLIVRLTDGRVLEGHMDAQTDERSLWIRRTESGIVLATAVAWSNVAAAEADDEPLNADELRRRRSELASEARPPEAASPVAAGAAPPPAVHRPATVRTLEIVDACVVNLDRDVEPDGLQLSVAAIDDHGAPLAVSGSLSVSLLGERRPWRTSGDFFGELDSWTHPVAAADFVDGVATYQFPFRRSAPEWQFDLLPDAMVTARLGAFGHGNYAASKPVVVRPFNPMRDNLQLQEGTRFLRGELQGTKTRHKLSAPEDGLWLHWTR